MVEVLVLNERNLKERWFTLDYGFLNEYFVDSIKRWLTNENGEIAKYRILDFNAECFHMAFKEIDEDLILSDTSLDEIVKLQNRIDIWELIEENKYKFISMLEIYFLDTILETNPEEFELKRNIKSYVEVAEDYLKHCYPNNKAVEELLPYITLKSFGEDIVYKNGRFICDYGYMKRKRRE